MSRKSDNQIATYVDPAMKVRLAKVAQIRQTSRASVARDALYRGMKEIDKEG